MVSAISIRTYHDENEAKNDEAKEEAQSQKVKNEEDKAKNLAEGKEADKK